LAHILVIIWNRSG